MARTSGRYGRPWRRVRALVLATSTTCHLCGHQGSGDVDHHPVPRKTLLALGLDPNDPQYLRPAHGALSRCGQCDPVNGKACNQVKGDRPATTLTTSRAW